MSRWSDHVYDHYSAKSNLDSIISEMEKDSSLKTVLYILPSIVNLDVFKDSIGEMLNSSLSIFRVKIELLQLHLDGGC